MPSDANAKMGWTWVFHIKGGSGTSTRLWNAWDIGSRMSALARVTLANEELPVVLASPETISPILLTTRHLFCGSRAVPVSQIENVRLVKLSQQRKTRRSALRIRLFDGRSFCMSVESDSSFFSLWNVLACISKRNRRTRLVRELARSILWQSCPRLLPTRPRSSSRSKHL